MRLIPTNAVPALRQTVSIGCVVLSVMTTSLVLLAPPARAETTPPAKLAWDQIANIKDAASRIGKLQRAKGVKAAYEFIDACYRTHSLAENYTAGFEACIAQDYLQTKMLVQIYQRTPPETLKKHGSPTPEVLAATVGRRIVAAFAQYKYTVNDANIFKALVDEHGVPEFMRVVFPEAMRELQERKAGKPKP